MCRQDQTRQVKRLGLGAWDVGCDAMGIKKGQDRPDQDRVCVRVKVKVKVHVRQTAGGSGAIRRYGRRAVNGLAARKRERGCEKGRDVRMKPRGIKPKEGRKRRREATSMRAKTWLLSMDGWTRIGMGSW